MEKIETGMENVSKVIKENSVAKSQKTSTAIK